MIGLKYTGKKIPFAYENENLVCGRMVWQEKKSVIRVPVEDAEFMVKYSGDDFEIVGHDDEEETNIPEVIVKEPVKPFANVNWCSELKKNGEPCKAPAMANGKCRFHGGEDEIEPEASPEVVGENAEPPGLDEHE